MVRSATPSESQSAQLSVDDMRRGIARLNRRVEEVEAFDPRNMSFDEIVSAKTELSHAIEASLERTFGRGTSEFDRYQNASFFSHSISLVEPIPLAQTQEEYRQCQARSLSLLKAAIRELEERLEEEAAQSVSPSVTADGAPKLHRDSEITDRAPLSRRIFVVHGHDDGAKQSVARFLEHLGFEPIILHERAAKGRTLIAKFQEESADVQFAVVLITPDDEGRAKDEKDLHPRARQNVILELGFFIGKLGTERVVPLVLWN